MPHRSPSILVVEDEGIVAWDIQQKLQDLGYDAYAVASSAEEALTRAAERSPDLVLMDIHIDGRTDGIGAAEILRTKYQMPVVYLTAHSDKNTVERAKLTEPYAYLTKPIRAAELGAAIEVSMHRHALERQLRERERWLTTTLRSIGDAIVAIDPGGDVAFMNQAAEKLLGCTPKDAVGRPIAEIVRLEEEPPGPVAEPPWHRALRDRSPISGEGTVPWGQDGEVRSVAISASPVMEGEDLLGAVILLRDITQQKMLQAQMELADRLSALGTMAAGIAHEVNNPLTIVLANADSALAEIDQCRPDLQGPSPPNREKVLHAVDEASEVLREIRTGAARIARVVADLRSFSRPLRETPVRVDVVPVLRWAVRTTVHEFHGRASVVTAFSDVPPVLADETRLGQLFINLLVNAAQAIDPGRPTDNEIRVATRSDGAGQVIVEFQDTGRRRRLEVEAFASGSFDGRQEALNGAGLKLSVCRWIVSSLGGRLVAETRPGKGSVVRVLLPAVSVER